MTSISKRMAVVCSGLDQQAVADRHAEVTAFRQKLHNARAEDLVARRRANPHSEDVAWRMLAILEEIGGDEELEEGLKELGQKAVGFIKKTAAKVKAGMDERGKAKRRAELQARADKYKTGKAKTLKKMNKSASKGLKKWTELKRSGGQMKPKKPVEGNRENAMQRARTLKASSAARKAAANVSRSAARGQRGRSMMTVRH